jgi:hypothetical protein
MWFNGELVSIDLSFAICSRVDSFIHDMTHDTLVNGVLGKLELTTCNFVANVIDNCHGTRLYPEFHFTHTILQVALHCETPNTGMRRKGTASDNH